MKVILALLFFVEINLACGQVTGIYVSDKGSNYFPTKIYLKNDLTYLYKESMDKHHTENEYFESGTYKVLGDTLYLSVNRVGFFCDKLSDEKNNKVAIIDKNSIYLSNEDGALYIKLSKKKYKPGKIFSDCYN